MKTPNPKDWTDDRCADLESLSTLLREVSSINHGSGCLQRIAKCIEIADSLSKTDYNTARPGFSRWLEELAVRDRFGRC